MEAFLLTQIYKTVIFNMKGYCFNNLKLTFKN